MEGTQDGGIRIPRAPDEDNDKEVFTKCEAAVQCLLYVLALNAVRLSPDHVP